MPAPITLSSATRQNLLSLQDTAALSAMNQGRLATGKKVNSAIDNPVNFFTARGLTDRSTALTGLLDGISNGIQTIQAANTGASRISDIIKSLQGTIAQAQTEAAANRPTFTGTALVAASDAKAAGTSIRTAALGLKLYGSAAAAPSDTTSGSLGISAARIAITLNDGDNTFTKYIDNASTSTANLGDVVDAINSSGIATANVDDAGKLTITGSSSSLKVGIGSGATDSAALTSATGASNDNAKFFGATNTPIYTTALTNAKTSAARTMLTTQFNSLRDQVTQVAKDSGFNGTNLLAGDNMSVIFNEKTGGDQSKLSITGQKLSSDSLGIGTAVNGTALLDQFDMQSDKSLAAMQDTLKAALSSLKSLQSVLGSNLSVVQVRQDFTKQLSDILISGASKLTDADMNEEAANSQALSTRNALAVSALSLANTAQQSILQLLR